jgi:PmbA protein
VKKIADLARKTETKAPKIAGTLPVIFTAQEMPNLLKSIELGINGKRLLKGDSPLIGREGERVLGTVTLTDNPCLDYAPGSRPFDDEGVVSQKHVLFDNGVFQTFLFDLDTAAKTSSKSTASATRSMLSTPVIAPSNLIMSQGESSLQEMVKGIEEGIIVYGVLGGGQSNLLAGDFALNIMLGFLIRNGELAGRLVDTMVSGNVYEAFGNIAAMNARVEQIGSLFVPDVMFSELSVSSR